jgi:REP element-mobilizing transposase RayT
MEGVPELLMSNLEFYKTRLKDLIAYTIMPNHMHVMVEVETIKSLSEFLRDFKKYTSRMIKIRLSVKPRYIWQRGTMDHCIRLSWENIDFRNHVQYLFYNSWKHLHIAPKDFRFHSFDEIVEKGWLERGFFDMDEKEFTLGKMYE